MRFIRILYNKIFSGYQFIKIDRTEHIKVTITAYGEIRIKADKKEYADKVYVRVKVIRPYRTTMRGQLKYGSSILKLKAGTKKRLIKRIMINAIER